MTCPNCEGPLVHWSDSTLGSYGNACLECCLFIVVRNGETHTMNLRDVPFPGAYRHIPSYRTLVGWCGP